VSPADSGACAGYRSASLPAMGNPFMIVSLLWTVALSALLGLTHHLFGVAVEKGA
jgi:hypothetical protein